MIAISLHETGPDGAPREVAFRGYERAALPDDAWARGPDGTDIVTKPAEFLTIEAGGATITHVGAHLPTGETVLYALASPGKIGGRATVKLNAGFYQRRSATPSYTCVACGGPAERVGDAFVRACGHDTSGVTAALSARARGVSRTGSNLSTAGGISVGG